jgi:hypothetical protein
MGYTIAVISYGGIPSSFPNLGHALERLLMIQEMLKCKLSVEVGAQVEHLPSKFETQSSNPSTTKK